MDAGLGHYVHFFPLRKTLSQKTKELTEEVFVTVSVSGLVVMEMISGDLL